MKSDKDNIIVLRGKFVDCPECLRITSAAAKFAQAKLAVLTKNVLERKAPLRAPGRKRKDRYGKYVTT